MAAPEKRRVLIVDDTAAIRQSVAAILTVGGYDVSEAGDGAEAISVVMGQRPKGESGIKLVVCDVNMPRMDGLTFIRLLRNLPDHKDLPVLMFTTEHAMDKKQEGASAGATFWLVKPSTPEELLKTVARFILP